MSDTPFKEWSSKLVELGYSLVPIAPGGKAPVLKGWQEFCREPATEKKLKAWQEHCAHFGIGVCLGEASQIIAVDIDIDSKELDFIYSPVQKVGKNGRTVFFRYDGEESKTYKTDTFKIDLLSNGRQTVIPPSIHPDTKEPYYWRTEGTLMDTKPHELPYFNLEALKKLIPERVVREKSTKGVLSSEWRDVESATMSLDASMDYESWLAVGMAIHSENSEEKGYNLFRKWSRTCPESYKKLKKGELVRKWKSFSSDGEVTIATMFDMAYEGGWSPEIDTSLVEGMKEPEKKVKPKEKIHRPLYPDIPYEITPPPKGSLVDEVFQFLRRGSSSPHEAFALSGAIAAVGGLKGGLFELENGLRPNVYLVNIGFSGSGKEDPGKLCETLFEEAGLGKYLMPEPASDSGLMAALILQPHCLFRFDEMGEAIQELTKQNASSWKALILKVLMTSFSNGTVRQKVTASAVDGKEPLVAKNTSLSIIGGSTPDSFYESLSPKFVKNGFLPRILVVPCSFTNPREAVLRTSKERQPPSYLLDRIEHLKGIREDHIAECPLVNDTTPIKIPYESAEVKAYVLKLTQKYIDMDWEARNGIRPFDHHAFFNRQVEHILKVALIVSDENTQQISMDSLKWAETFVERTMGVMMEAVDKNVIMAGSSQQMQAQNKIIKALNDWPEPEMKQGDLYKYTNLSAREIKDPLNTLELSGRIGKRKGRTQNVTKGPETMLYWLI